VLLLLHGERLIDNQSLSTYKNIYTDIYVNTQQLLLNTTLFYTWRHVSAAHTAIFSLE